MPKFFVRVKEVHTNTVTVEAYTAEEALGKVWDDVECGDTELSYDFTLVPESWTVEDDKGNILIEPRGSVSICPSGNNPKVRIV
jgi:hypothetical protein